MGLINTKQSASSRVRIRKVSFSNRPELEVANTNNFFSYGISYKCSEKFYYAMNARCKFEITQFQPKTTFHLNTGFDYINIYIIQLT